MTSSIRTHHSRHIRRIIIKPTLIASYGFNLILFFKDFIPKFNDSLVHFSYYVQVIHFMRFKLYHCLSFQ
jgi:hypothetical protein